MPRRMRIGKEQYSMENENQTVVVSESEQKQIRKEKLRRLQEAGRDP